ncbi:hypothetical protein Tco_1158647, partial [Tanacetum coccineum]
MHVACFKISLGTMKTNKKSVKRKPLDECDHIFYIAANTVNDNVAVTISTNILVIWQRELRSLIMKTTDTTVQNLY